MIRLRIIKIDNSLYKLEDINNNVYEITIYFYDIDDKVGVDDYLYMREKLLSKINHSIISLGVLDSMYGKVIEEINDEDLAILITNNKRISLKRYYG
jgi:hypothetical protein